MPGIEVGNVLAVGVVRLVGGLVPDDPEPQGGRRTRRRSHRSSPNFR